MRSKLASSIAILLNYGAKWRVLYYIFYVLCLDFNLGLLIDPQILYYNTYTNVELKSTLYMNTPLASNGPLQRVIGFSIFTRYLQDNQISTIYAVFIVITVVVCGLTSLFYFHYPSGAPLKYTRFMAVISNILCYYDYWYLIFFELFLRTFTCVPRFVEEKKLSLDTTNTSTTDDSQLRLVKISISSLNSNLQCWTVDHIFIGIMGAVILVCNICLKFINNKILTHRPNPRLPSKMSSADLMHLMLMVTIMLMKIIFSAAGYDRGIDLKLFYIICFGILLLDISIHTMARPFYSSKSNYLRSFEMVSVILILIITLVSLWSSPDSQPSANKIVTSQIVITMLLVLTAVMKLYSSLGEKIDWRGSSKKSKQQSDLLRFIEESVRYVQHAVNHQSIVSEKDTYMLKVLNYYQKYREDLKSNPEALRKILPILERHVQSQNLAQFVQEQVAIATKTKKQPPRSSILNNFDEPFASELKSIVQLMTYLLEFSIKDGLDWSNQHLINAYVFHQHYFRGRIQRAAHIIRMSPKNKSLDLDILYELMALKIEENLRTSNLFMTDCRYKLHFLLPQKNLIDMSHAITFINLFSTLRSKISQKIHGRLKFLDSCAQNKLSVSQAFISSLKDRDSDQICEEMFTKLLRQMDGKSTPLNLTLAFYQHFVDQDFSKAAETLKTTISKKFTIGMDIIPQLEASEMYHLKENSFEQEPVIMGVSGEEETFHMIDYVTPNIEEKLQFKVNDVMHHDLSVIIPNPFWKKHRQLFDPDRSNGILFESKTGRKLYIYKKNHSVREIWLAIRLNSNLKGGLQVLGRIGFQTEVVENQLMVLNKDHEILEVSSGLQNYFKLGMSLESYNFTLREKLAAFIKVASYKITNPQLDLAMVFHSDLDMADLRTYIQLTEGLIVHLVTLECNTPSLHVKIQFEESYVSKLDELVIFCDVIIINSSGYGISLADETPVRKKRSSGLGTMMDFLKFVNKQNLELSNSRMLPSLNTHLNLGDEEIPIDSRFQTAESGALPKTFSPTTAISAFLGKKLKTQRCGSIRGIHPIVKLVHNRLKTVFKMIKAKANNVHTPIQHISRLMLRDLRSNAGNTQLKSLESHGSNLDKNNNTISRLSAILRSRRKHVKLPGGLIFMTMILVCLLTTWFVLGSRKYSQQYKSYNQINKRLESFYWSEMLFDSTYGMVCDLQLHRLTSKLGFPDNFFAEYDMKSVVGNLDARRSRETSASPMYAYSKLDEAFVEMAENKDEIAALERDTGIDIGGSEIVTEPTGRKTIYSGLIYLQPYLTLFCNGNLSEGVVVVIVKLLVNHLQEGFLKLSSSVATLFLRNSTLSKGLLESTLIIDIGLGSAILIIIASFFSFLSCNLQKQTAEMFRFRVDFCYLDTRC